MTDEPRARPPDKRKRRPGQEAASLGYSGKANGSYTVINADGLSINMNTAWCKPCVGNRAADIFPALFPDGEIVDDGKRLRVGAVKIDLKNGHWIDTSNGRRGGPDLYGLSLAVEMELE